MRVMDTDVSAMLIGLGAVGMALVWVAKDDDTMASTMGMEERMKPSITQTKMDPRGTAWGSLNRRRLLLGPVPLGSG